MKPIVKGKKKFIFATITCFILSATLLFIAFWVTALFESPTNEVNTIEFKGTFEGVEKDKKNFLISVDEYKCKLILNSATVVDADYLLRLNEGKTIYFRINDFARDLLGDTSVTQLTIITVRTAEKNIATLKSYNMLEKKQATNAKITGIVFSIVFALVGVYSLLRLNGVVIFKRKEKRS